MRKNTVNIEWIKIENITMMQNIGSRKRAGEKIKQIGRLSITTENIRTPLPPLTIITFKRKKERRSLKILTVSCFLSTAE
jgi:hypothetical protein